MAPSVSVRIAETRDIPTIASIALTCFAGDFTDPRTGAPAEALAVKWVDGRIRLGDFGAYFIIEVDGRAIGYVLYLLIGGLSGIVQLEQIGILEELRGQGYGRRLINESEPMILGRIRESFNLAVSKLFLTTSAVNDQAHQLYGRCGYSHVATIPKFFWGVDEEVWVKSTGD